MQEVSTRNHKTIGTRHASNEQTGVFIKRNKKKEMKKKLICTALMLALLSACGPKESKNADTASLDTLASTTQLAPADTLAVIMNTRHNIDSMATSALNVEFPVANKKKAALIGSIREWISEELGGTYGNGLQGDYDKLLGDTTAVMDHYFAGIEKYNATNWHDIMDNLDGAERPEMELYDSIAITKWQEGQQWVTMQYVNSVYLGGAHGSYLIFGQTFRKSDGRRIGWEIIRKSDDPEDNIQSLMRKGLVEYFGDGNPDFKEEELGDYLQGEANAYYIPMPQCPPLFTKEGIMFLYNQYEIAAYAAGLPQFVISYKDLMPYLTETAKRLIK